jgi:hypothetical protein
MALSAMRIVYVPRDHVEGITIFAFDFLKRRSGNRFTCELYLRLSLVEARRMHDDEPVEANGGLGCDIYDVLSVLVER